jgi:signal transduction histidine kinase/CheY-like chemotaxis protein
VTLSSTPRSISLFAQLLLTFVALVAATATGLTIMAYQTSLSRLEETARRDARTAAQVRDQMLSQLLRLRQQRADGFLASVQSLCGEPLGGRRFGWSGECVRTMVREFTMTEQALGSTLTYDGRRLATGGVGVAATSPEGSGWKVVDRGLRTTYQTASRLGDATLTLEFDGRDAFPIFADRSGLGLNGEVFLVDAGGRALTPLRYATDTAVPEAAQQCREGAHDVIGVDYRGARAIRAFRPVAALSSACVIAHYDHAEALAPAASLRGRLLVQGVIFVVAGVLLSLVAARLIAAPVQRLAQSARALQAGNFGERVPVTGPSEVRRLGHALSAMASDLAELVAQEQTARREAEAANRSKDQFLTMLSHELRTPLTAVLGWAHTLRAGPLSAERVEKAAAAIERSAEAQRRLIEDLLDVTGIAAGRVRLVAAPTLLTPIIDAALDAVGPRADEKGVTLAHSVEHADLVVHGDPQRLQQVFWNLLWNAVKFTPAGGRVGVHTRAVGGLVEVTVSDTGVGIEPDFLPHVFGWFRRADRDGKSRDEGLGLGLALVRQLAELHGGSVRAESLGRDRGSTFVVTLPLHQEEVAVQDRLPRDAGQPDGQERLASIRVLVVDDDPGSREAVRVLLEQVGAQVETVASAAEARRHLRSATTDVLISDIAMAQESGYTLMETLRAEGLTLPGIALTGYARREDADRAYAAGFDVHLPKPVDPDVLVSVLVAVTKRETVE